MVKVKGAITQKRHKKILEAAKGFRGARSRQYRRAKEAVLHAEAYAFAGRKRKKRDIRTLWIQRINAALSQYGISYSKFMKDLKSSGMEINRKVLSQLASEKPDAFKSLVEKVTKK